MLRETFPARLRAARREAELTQSQLARLMGEELGNIRNWERRGILPGSVEKLKLLAQVLAVSSDYLLGLDDASGEAAVPAPSPPPINPEAASRAVAAAEEIARRARRRSRRASGNGGSPPAR